MDTEMFARFKELESRHWWFLARRDIILAVIGQYALPGAGLLDVGCGTGFFLDRARDRYRTAGIDPSPIALAMCAERNLKEIRAGDAMDLSAFGSERFDVVTLLDVIEHVDDDVAALRAARSVLSATGRVIVTVPAFQFLWTAHDELNHHRRRYTKRLLIERFEASGLVVERVSYFNTYLFPLALAERMVKRLFHLGKGPDLSLPPALLNRTMRTVFAFERAQLERGGSFPVGLSVLGVGRPSASAVEGDLNPMTIPGVGWR
jgi:2-polyprenyl-3-methyl-5-hydroxy-6-metoxy-1,4-benzoquinol methylase